MRRLESIADDDRMRWHALLHILLSWVVQRRPRQDKDPLLGLVAESQRSQAHKREVEMERATMEQTGAEWMAEQIENRLQKEMSARQMTVWREVLLGTLTDRFGTLPASVVSAVNTCEQPDRLQTATRKAGTIASLEDFQL